MYRNHANTCLWLLVRGAYFYPDADPTYGIYPDTDPTYGIYPDTDPTPGIYPDTHPAANVRRRHMRYVGKLLYLLC